MCLARMHLHCMCSPARVALWCSQHGNSTSGGNAVCRDPEWALSGLGREMLTFSAGGEKASVHRGMQTTMVGLRPKDETILSVHLWHPPTQMRAINLLNLQMSHLNVSNMIIQEGLSVIILLTI